MTISGLGKIFNIFRAASKPLSSGMLISMTTTLGLSCSASVTASRPVLASAQTSQPGLELSNCFRPRRTMSWSSATRICMASPRGLIDFSSLPLDGLSKAKPSLSSAQLSPYSLFCYSTYGGHDQPAGHRRPLRNACVADLNGLNRGFLVRNSLRKKCFISQQLIHRVQKRAAHLGLSHVSLDAELFCFPNQLIALMHGKNKYRHIRKGFANFARGFKTT